MADKDPSLFEDTPEKDPALFDDSPEHKTIEVTHENPSSHLPAAGVFGLGSVAGAAGGVPIAAAIKAVSDTATSPDRKWADVLKLYQAYKQNLHGDIGRATEANPVGMAASGLPIAFLEGGIAGTAFPGAASKLASPLANAASKAAQAMAGNTAIAGLWHLGDKNPLTESMKDAALGGVLHLAATEAPSHIVGAAMRAPRAIINAAAEKIGSARAAEPAPKFEGPDLASPGPADELADKLRALQEWKNSSPQGAADAAKESWSVDPKTMGDEFYNLIRNAHDQAAKEHLPEFADTETPSGEAGARASIMRNEVTSKEIEQELAASREAKTVGKPVSANRYKGRDKPAGMSMADFVAAVDEHEAAMKDRGVPYKPEPTGISGKARSEDGFGMKEVAGEERQSTPLKRGADRDKQPGHDLHYKPTMDPEYTGKTLDQEALAEEQMGMGRAKDRQGWAENSRPVSSVANAKPDVNASDKEAIADLLKRRDAYEPAANANRKESVEAVMRRARELQQIIDQGAAREASAAEHTAAEEARVKLEKLTSGRDALRKALNIGGHVAAAMKAGPVGLAGSFAAAKKGVGGGDLLLEGVDKIANVGDRLRATRSLAEKLAGRDDEIGRAAKWALEGGAARLGTLISVLRDQQSAK